VNKGPLFVHETVTMFPEKPVKETVIRSCSTCRFFMEKEKGGNIGGCVRYPPSIGSLSLTRFPEVERSWWCGEYKGREEQAIQD